MPKIVWDKAGEHFYETGVDHGVLYPTNAGVYGKGVAWNGLTGVTESPSGAESTGQYADNIKYLNLISAEEFGATIEAFTYPPEFSVCDGSAEPTPGVMIGQQTRKPFGMSYRTLLGNDLQNTDYGYKLHIIYGATASPSERAYSTVNDSPEAITFSWEVTTTPVEVTGYKPTASLVIDSTKVAPANMATLENILYGSETGDPRLPMPDEVISIIGSSSSITITVEPITDTILGKPATTIQTDIVVNDNAISGTLKYVENFTEFGSDELANGNFLGLDIGAVDSDGNVVSTDVKLVGGSSSNSDIVTEEEIDNEVEEGTEIAVHPKSTRYVMRITNKDAQSVRVTATSNKGSSTKLYSLKGLVLEDASSLG